MSSPGSPTATTDGIREAVRDARVEAAVAMLTALALLVVNGLVSRSQGWGFPAAPGGPGSCWPSRRCCS